MIPCRVCNTLFDPKTLPDDPEVQVGIVLAQERFDDLGLVCGICLVSRGRLAMMYDPECRR